LNNSDIIASLSLFLTGAIFLAQTNGALVRLKFRRREMIAGGALLAIIVLLVNSPILERWGIGPYFSLGRFYLTPAEWALIIFLLLFSVILRRVFSDKLYAEDTKLILSLLRRYRADGDYQKSWYLLEQVLTAGADTALLEILEIDFFSHDHFIQKTAAERPYLLMQFRQQYKYAALNTSRPLYYMLSGLFASAANPVYNELETYSRSEAYGEVLKALIFLDKEDLPDYPGKSLHGEWPILDWFTVILQDMTGSFKDEVLYFLRFLNKQDENNNLSLYTQDEIEILLKRDPVYNALKLFRIGLFHHLYNNPKKDLMIDRVLIIFYSSWEFLLSRTQLKTEGVALNNDEFTINEYLLRYQFESYLVVVMAQAKIAAANPGHEINEWTIKQLFAKLEGLLGSDGQVGMRSKQYYLTEIFDFYFEPDKYGDSEVVQLYYRRLLLIYIKGSLEGSPYGDDALITEAYQEAFDSYDFVPFQEDKALVRGFYSELLPYTEDFEYDITGTVS